jgi:coenzyme F420 hydrogenase subunit beta
MHGIPEHVISEIVDKDLCCGCGACVGVCLAQALSIDVFKSYKPIICLSKCTDCGLCLAVCPGSGYPVVQWSQQKYQDVSTLVDKEVGPVLNCLKGHSTNSAVRLNSSSGGVATSLLTHLLESGQVDEVSVIGMKDDRPVAILTSDPEVVCGSLASKYGPVPLLATLIPELRRRPRRIAITVTPCQLAGLRKAEEFVPHLKDSIVLTLGLFCGYIQSYDSLASIAATLGVEYPAETRFISWRYGTYPGSARFEFSDGSAVEKSLYPWLDVAIPHFSLNRCFLCADGGNWLADMTLGDIHSGGSDETVIVCRNQKAHDALVSAQDAGKIAMAELTTSEIEHCVIKHIVDSKLRPAMARNRWLKKEGRAVPVFDYESAQLFHGRKKLLAVLWVWQYRLVFWCRTLWRRSYLLKHPWLLEKTGHFLYRFPVSIPGWRFSIKIWHGLRNIYKSLTS